MIIGTIFTLFVVPSIYVVLAHTHKRDEAAETDMETLSEEPEEAVA